MKRSLGVIGCPPATQDVLLNLKNRAWAIRNVAYGPPNPSLRNDAYWGSLALEWGTTKAVARTMRCGNCAAFNVSPRVRGCIEMGVGGDARDVDQFISAGELGYCTAFKFKCAASRTCHAWVAGGPVTVER
jgi:hypothetical protein